jgi:hypothetical protein
MSDLKTEVVNIRLTKQVKEALSEKAKADERTTTNLIQKILKEAVSKPA